MADAPEVGGLAPHSDPLNHIGIAILTCYIRSNLEDHPWQKRLALRFDRRLEGNKLKRIPFASALRMLEALEIAAHRYSYRDLAEAIRRFGSDPLSDLRELFRRMAFNILVGNDEDHLRNHAFLFDGCGWRLSPLYNVISRPHVGSNGCLILAVGDRGHEATLANALTGAATYGLDREEAATLLGIFVCA